MDEQGHGLAQQGFDRVHHRASANVCRIVRARTRPTHKNMSANAGRIRSPPGQATPKPSPVQNTPKAESITPTANLERVLRDAHQWSVHKQPDGENDKAGGNRAESGGTSITRGANPGPEAPSCLFKHDLS